MQSVFDVFKIFRCPKIYPTEQYEIRVRSKTESEYEITLREEFSRRMDIRRNKPSRMRGYSF